MTEKVKSYTGPPLWIMAMEWRNVVSRLPEDAPGMTAVRVSLADGKYTDTFVVGDSLIELPAPYTCRDIAAIRKLA